jgi:hypothetical protein
MNDPRRHAFGSKDLTTGSTQRASARLTRLGSLPTASGGIARAAYAAAKKARLDVRALLKKSDLTIPQAEKPDIRISVKSQIKFLNEGCERPAGRCSRHPPCSIGGSA